MLGGGSRSKPAPAGEFSASDNSSDLNAHLQKQLEEDIARIFDESIYSDLEVVCGKLKILTHTCILKTRTSNFFHKLQSILHVNIEQSTFDEIYSFVSDVYTECNIELQEREIIAYLNEQFYPLIPIVHNTYAAIEDFDKIHPFYIPDCTENSYNKNIFSKTKGSSPSTELTKEYYALVPINGNLLEKELIEQDELSHSFLSIIKTQVEDKIESKSTHLNKPTSLSLSENNFNKTIKQSSEQNTRLQRNNIIEFEDNIEYFSQTNSIQESKLNHLLSSSNTSDFTFKNSEQSAEIFIDSTYSPDSLITDEPSSSSDYLSATFTCSPGTSISSHYYNLTAGDNFTKMAQNGIFTKSDSGLDSTGMHESLNSHVDVTLADLSITETHLHSTIEEEATNSLECEQPVMSQKQETQNEKSLPSSSVDKMLVGKERCDSRHINKSNIISGKSAKEEKQRQNAEIVILESSPVSLEIESCDPSFPPFLGRKNLSNKTNKKQDNLIKEENILDRKRSASFIEKEWAVSPPNNSSDKLNINENRAISIPIPVTCAFNHSFKYNKSSGGLNNLSEENDNEASIDDQIDDSDANDESRTIFDMTFETSTSGEDVCETTCSLNPTSKFDMNTTTPNNSIMLVKNHELSNDIKASSNINTQLLNDSILIKTGNMSVGDQIQFSNEQDSTLNRNETISRACVSEIEDTQPKNEIKLNKPTTAAWVIDVSKESNTDSSLKGSSNKSDDKVSGKNNFGSKNNKENEMKLHITDSESNNKLSRSFYVDLTSLPEPLSTNSNKESARGSEKDNIFTMYIDIGTKSELKGKPPILQSTNTRKTLSTEHKFTNKNPPKPNVKYSSPGLATFEKIESLCNDPNISITEIIKIPESQNEACVLTDIKQSTVVESSKEANHSKVLTNNINTKNLTIVAAEESASDSFKESVDTFVKLSDLDKPIVKSSDFDIHESKALISETLYEGKIWDARMTRSIPDHNWGDPAHSGSSVITSFHSENALSLNRLFPNLLNKFSRSVPASLPGRPRSLLKLEYSSNMTEEETQPSDTSDISSVHSSSVCRSMAENSTTDEYSQTSSLAGSCQSRLGQDLLRMFLEEIATDVIVEVNGKRIKAHKCILSSRCQFFAGILSGGYVESAGNVIILPSFSYNVAHFAMCHIYAGISEIPDSISIPELATLADMLGLEGLKEAIMFTLKVKYCHHFHKPCQVCIAGVLECFPLSSVYGLDDLYLKCLKWITKHFIKVWPTKAFATLPTELLEKCYHQHAINFTTENFVEMVYGYGLTMASLQNSRWAEILVRMCRRLIQAAAHFAAARLVEVLRTIGHTSATVSPPALQALEECLTAAIDWAPSEEACRAYAFLSNTVRDIKSQQQAAKPDVVNANCKPAGPNSLLFYRAAIWRLQCEGALVRAAPRVVSTKAFQELPSELKKRLRELGCILFISPTVPQVTLSQSDKKKCTKSKYGRCHSSSASRSVDIDHVRAAFVPYSTKPVLPVNVLDISDNYNSMKERRNSKRTQPPKVRMTKAQEQRAKFNMNKNVQRLEQTNIKTFSINPKQSETRVYKENEKILNTSNKFSLKTKSSSESSRNSSPNPVRRYRMKDALKYEICEKKAQAMSQDSLSTSSRPHTAEPASDSLSESRNSTKYGTYTKEKHTVKGSVESIKCTKYHTMVRDEEMYGRIKTKIPVTINHNMKSLNKNSSDILKKSVDASMIMTSNPNNNVSYISCGKTSERKYSGSLMKATKSSSAKKVPKVIKDHSKCVVKNKSLPKASNKPEQPTMSRSGTFLMDQPNTSQYNIQ